MTAWAATQSQMLRVRIISQVTRLNQTKAASSSPGCISIGTAVPTTAASGVTLPKGTSHQRSLMHEPHQEAAEEELFDDRHDQREAEEANGEKGVGPGRRVVELFERVVGGTLAEAEEGVEAKRREQLRFEVQLADPDPEHDADHADDNRQRRDAKRELPIAGQHVTASRRSLTRSSQCRRSGSAGSGGRSGWPCLRPSRELGEMFRCASWAAVERLGGSGFEAADEHVDDERQQEGEPRVRLSRERGAGSWESDWPARTSYRSLLPAPAANES